MIGFFSVKNWEEYQHYKDRDPTWIKLYNRLLDNYDFGLLPDASKWHLIGIFLLASRYKNKIPADAAWVANKIGATTIVDLTLLAKSDFIELDQVCTDPLAEPYQVASPEKSREETQVTRERQKEDIEASSKPASPKRERKVQTSLPDDCPTEADRNAAARHWRDRGRGDLCASLGDQVEAFRAHHIAHGKRMADWGAAWRTWYGNAIRFQAKPKQTAGNASTAPRPAFDDTHDDRWRERFRTFQVRGSWSSNWGPKPGEEGCRCPPQILGGDA